MLRLQGCGHASWEPGCGLKDHGRYVQSYMVVPSSYVCNPGYSVSCYCFSLSSTLFALLLIPSPVVNTVEASGGIWHFISLYVQCLEPNRYSRNVCCMTILALYSVGMKYSERSEVRKGLIGLIGWGYSTPWLASHHGRSLGSWLHCVHSQEVDR